ncbi:MAG TPA: isochorismatase family protein [Bryobacteraceae bacterium]|nr:isochorismatase family protein [Bryobacteraceae bacterium]
MDVTLVTVKKEIIMIDYKSWKPSSNGENRANIRRQDSIQDGLRHVSGDGTTLINPADAALLLLNHQSGLLQVVKDIGVKDLRANTAMLAKLATLMDLPVITSSLVPEGPNGPLIPEIRQFAPHAVYVPRKGEINAWDNEQFVAAVHETGRKTLIMAGVWSSIFLIFPALEAKAAGFKVYAVTDASGDSSEMSSRTTLARLSQAGVVLASALTVLSELHRTWDRRESAELAKLYTMVAPNYVTVKETSILDWQAARLHY